MSKLKIANIDGNWVDGTFDGKRLEAKIFMDPSGHGINSGRVSKFYYENCSFERGWNTGEEDIDIWSPVIEALEQFAQSKRFVESFQEVSR